MQDKQEIFLPPAQMLRLSTQSTQRKYQGFSSVCSVFSSEASERVVKKIILNSYPQVEYLVVIIKKASSGNYFSTMYSTGDSIRNAHKDLKEVKP